MSIIEHVGNWVTRYPRKRASQAFTANTLVAMHSDDDTVTPATSATTALVNLGIIVQKIAATDTDYADNTRVAVRVPQDETALMLCDTNADIAVTDEGELHDLTDAGTVDPAATSVNAVKFIQFVSARKGIYKLNNLDLV
jgi:hypothetical protein